MRLWQYKPIVPVLALILSLVGFPAFAGPYVLLDVGSGRVLAQEDPFKRWYPASLTKLMTAYAAFRAVKAGEVQLRSPVTISANANKEPPSKMGYAAGSALSLDNALKIILVKSANDVATAIGESIGGSQEAFAARMNAEARRLGMVDSQFVNAHGLHSPDQFTTARDMALLVRAIRTEFPQYAGYFSIEGLEHQGKALPNVNLLIGRFDGADGMKTGYICASGFNLVATATRRGRTLAAIVLGAHSQVERAVQAAELLARGFNGGGFGAPALASLRPTAADRHVPTDMRNEICTAEAVAKRNEKRDGQGRLVVESEFVGPLGREMRLVSVGLDPAATAVASAKVSGYVNVPIPTPRPQYPPQAVPVGQGD